MDAAASEGFRHDRLHGVLTHGPGKAAAGGGEVLRAIHAIEERQIVRVGRIGERITNVRKRN